MLSGHKGADLSQNGDQSILTEKGAFASHIRSHFCKHKLANIQLLKALPRYKPDAFHVTDEAIIADKRSSLLLQPYLDHRMPSANDFVAATFLC